MSRYLSALFPWKNSAGWLFGRWNLFRQAYKVAILHNFRCFRSAGMSVMYTFKFTGEIVASPSFFAHTNRKKIDKIFAGRGNSRMCIRSHANVDVYKWAFFPSVRVLLGRSTRRLERTPKLYKREIWDNVYHSRFVSLEMLRWWHPSYENLTAERARSHDHCQTQEWRGIGRFSLIPGQWKVSLRSAHFQHSTAWTEVRKILNLELFVLDENGGNGKERNYELGSVWTELNPLSAALDPTCSRRS